MADLTDDDWKLMAHFARAISVTPSDPNDTEQLQRIQSHGHIEPFWNFNRISYRITQAGRDAVRAREA
jgi:DNA-binding PadR family transcriptional regulator